MGTIIRAAISAATAAILVSLAAPAAASSGGIVGYTKRDIPGGAGCGVCHGATTAGTVTISGPASVVPGSTVAYTIAMSGIAAGTAAAGFNAAVGKLATQPTFQAASGLLIGDSSTQATHSAAQAPSGGAASWTVNLAIPAGATAGTTYTLYAAANAGYGADQYGWNHANNLAITVAAALPANPSGLSASPASTSTVNLSWFGSAPEYKLLRKTGSFPTDPNDAAATAIYTGTNKTFSDTGLATGTAYFYRVWGKASGSDTFSSGHSQATATTFATPVARFVNAATGNDDAGANTCTASGSPCRTITRAMTAAAPGDSISVAPGTYSVALGEVFPIAFKNGVQLFSTGSAADTIVDGTGDTVRRGLVTSTGNTSPAARIEGFTFKSGTYRGEAGNPVGGGALHIDYASGTFTVARNVFAQNQALGFNAGDPGSLGATGTGIWGGAINGFSSAVSIQNNVFWANTARGGNGQSFPGQAFDPNATGGSGQGGAIYLSGSGSIVNNTFHENAAIGGNGGTGNNGSASRGTASGGALVVYGIEVKNNIFTNNAATSGSGATVPGENSSAGAVSASPSSSATNLLNGNLVDGAASTDDVPLTGTVTNAPAYHSAPSNFRLRNSSPAKGAGTASGAPAADFLGTTRGTPPAIGAYEAYFVTQTITFGTPPVVSVGGTGTVSATGGASGNPVALTSQTTNTCTISGTTVTGIAAGTCTIAANQAGSTDFSAATQASQTFSIQAAPTSLVSVTKEGTGTGTVASAPAGIDCGSTCSANFTQGGSVTLTATAAAGSAFAGWTGACTGTGTCVVNVGTSSASVTATFTALTTFAVSISGAQEVPPNGSTGFGSGTATINPVANTIAYAFNVTGLTGSLAGAHFHGPAARGANAGVMIDIGANPFSGTVTYQEADEAAILGGQWYVNYHTAAFPGGELRGQLDNLGGLFTLTVAKSGTGSGTITSAPAGIDCGSDCSEIYASGTPVTLTATPTSPATFGGWSGACTGTGICQVTMSQARNVTATFSAPVTPPPPANPPRLGNISTRGPVLTGNDVMIGGFIIAGSGPKKVLITARGPSLAAFGVSGVLANPKLELFSGQAKITENDDWQANGAGDIAAIQATGIAPSSPQEAALMVTLNPGPYTAIVSGADGGTGVAIVEVFEQGNADIPLINISTRGQVQTVDKVMIGGFIIQGDAPKTVLVTARGPSLAPFGILNPLANPKLEIFSGPTKILENDDWETNANKADIVATGVAPTNALESALLVTLNPGAYTAIVSGAGGGTGVGIVEVFAR
jgi:hypothetical protein